MNIQVSVLIWTIICFCLLMLILNKLLFTPILAVMDQRQERIRRGREKQSADAEAYAAAQTAMEQAREDIRKQQAQAMARTVDEAQARADAQVAEARAAGTREVEAYRQQLMAERQALKTKLDARLDSLAATFANRLAS